MNFKRLLLNNIQEFTITPTEALQLVLGSNGSGKSSLLQELTPLPANHQDFTKEGCKEITIEHNRSTYVLTNVFGNTQKHYFLKDGEELNTGNTLTVQRDLVKQEFSITPDIHELIITQKGFHDLSPIERRYWFTKLSDVSYEYAIGIYLKLKEKSRDVSGALKLAKKRLITETSKIISNEEQNVLQNEINDLYEFINYLMELRKPIEKQLSTLKNNSQTIENELNKLSTLYFKKKSSLINLSNFNNLEEIKAKIILLQSNVEVEKRLINNYILDHTKFSEVIKNLKLTENTNLESLNLGYKLLVNEYTTLLNKQKLKLNIEDFDTASRAFDTVYDILSSVFVSLPENSDHRYSRQNLILTDGTVSQIKNEINRLTSDNNKLLNQKENQEHQRDHDKTQCPQCSYSWSRGYDSLIYKNICDTLKNNEEELSKLKEQLKEKEYYLSEIKNYSDVFKDFNNCVSNWPILKPLWDYILDNKYIFTNPKLVLKTLEEFKYDLTLGLESNKIKNRINETIELINLTEKNNHEDISNIDEKIFNLETLINQSTEDTNNFNNEINKLQSLRKDVELLFDIDLKIKALIDSHDLNTKDTHETYRRTSFNELIKSVQISLSHKEQNLSEIKVQKAIVNDLSNQIDVMEIDNEAYKLLVKELSPTDGLIAQGLLGFIKVFVKQMNILIKKIWAYPLEVIPCGITDNVSVELDYKFPLMVQDADNIISDVSKGSSAMREVVDLAFKVVSMKYLGLGEYPLILDEPCSAMDNEHKITSMSAITSLLETQNFTQLFLVSHDHAQYGSLTNAEVCILCTNNIVPPANTVFNKHVKFS